MSVAIIPSADNRPGMGGNDEWLLCASWMLTNGGSPFSIFHEIRFGPARRRQEPGHMSFKQLQNSPEVVQLLPAVGCVNFTLIACPTKVKHRKTGRKYIAVGNVLDKMALDE
jgi:hypothetical protein